MIALEETTDIKIRPGEFTVYDYIDELQKTGVILNRQTAARRLDALIHEGKLVMRKGIVNGKLTNIYLAPQPK
jgi:predicted urease superfamily metal-dependent hydrolase